MALNEEGSIVANYDYNGGWWAPVLRRNLNDWEMEVRLLSFFGEIRLNPGERFLGVVIIKELDSPLIV